MSTPSFRDSNEYRHLPRIQRLWVDLSTATNASGLGESVLARRAIPPWDSEEPKVAAAWHSLTAPENLDDLLGWLNPNMNSMARSYTERAIEEYRKRHGGNVEQ